MLDWKGNKLNYDEEVYVTEDGLVREEDIEEYIGLIYTKTTVDEYIDIIEKGE